MHLLRAAELYKRDVQRLEARNRYLGSEDLRQRHPGVRTLKFQHPGIDLRPWHVLLL